MGLLEPNRRGFLGGLIAALAAPAIVQAQNIMPVRTPLIVRRPPSIVIPAPRWLVTDVTLSMHSNQLATAHVSLVEAFGGDQSLAMAVNRKDCHEAEWRQRIERFESDEIRSDYSRPHAVRGQVHREASFSCDHDVARGLMPGDIVTFSNWPDAQDSKP